MANKVMVVDDDQYIRMSVKLALGRAGIDVAEADGGRECLRQMQAGFKGVILMDLMMPDMDGWDTIRAIVDQGYLDGSMIFVLTALESPDKKMEGLEQYVTGCATKTFDADELLDAVQEYLSYLD